MTKRLWLRATIALASLLLIALLGVWLLGARAPGVSSEITHIGSDPDSLAGERRKSEDIAKSGREAPGESGLDALPGEPGRSSQQRVQTSRVSLHSLYGCDDGSEDARYCARNEDEAVWLRNAGVPTANEIAYVRAAPDRELEARAARSDVVAAMELAKRHRLAGREQEALQWRRDPLNRGSVYAHNAMADLLLESASPQDLAGAAVHLRVAQQLGDVRAMLRLHGLVAEHQELDWRSIDFPAMAMIQAIERNNPGVCLSWGVRPVRDQE